MPTPFRSILIALCGLAVFIPSGPIQAGHPQGRGDGVDLITQEEGAFNPEELPPITEYNNIPIGLMVSPKKAIAPKPTVKKTTTLPASHLGNIPGVYAIPGVKNTAKINKRVLSLSQIMGAYREGQYDIVLKNLIPMAETGHHTAEELLGIMYFQGQGIEKDFAKAKNLLLRAAESQYPLAQHYLSTLHYQGAGLAEPDIVTALMWIHISILYYEDGPEKTRALQDRDSLFVNATRLQKGRARQMTRNWLVQRGEAYLLEIHK